LLPQPPHFFRAHTSRRGPGSRGRGRLLLRALTLVGLSSRELAALPVHEDGLHPRVLRTGSQGRPSARSHPAAPLPRCPPLKHHPMWQVASTSLCALPTNITWPPKHRHSYYCHAPSMILYSMHYGIFAQTHGNSSSAACHRQERRAPQSPGIRRAG